MSYKNINETLTNDKLSVPKDYSIPKHESTTLEKIIKILVQGELKENGFVEWYNIK